MDGVKSFKTLKTGQEYARVYKKGDNYHSSFFVIFFIRSYDKKVGFVASKKVGNAVCRNRCKRILRESFYHSISDVSVGTLSQGTYVFIAKKKLLEIGFHQARCEFDKMLKKINYKKALA